MANVNFPQELAKLKAPIWQKIQTYLPSKSPHNHYTVENTWRQSAQALNSSQTEIASQ